MLDMHPTVEKPPQLRSFIFLFLFIDSYPSLFKFQRNPLIQDSISTAREAENTGISKLPILMSFVDFFFNWIQDQFLPPNNTELGN